MSPTRDERRPRPPPTTGRTPRLASRRRGRGLLAETGPAGRARRASRPRPSTPDEDSCSTPGRSRSCAAGLAVTPELRQGICFTVLMALATAAREAGGAGPDPADPRPGRAGRRGVPPGFVLPGLRGRPPLGVGPAVPGRPGHLPAAGAGVRGQPARPAGAGLRPHPPAVDGRAQRAAPRARWWPGSPATSRPWPSSSSGARWRGSSTRVLIVATFAVMAVYDWRLALVAVVVSCRWRAAADAAAPPARGPGPGAQRRWASRCPRCPRP